MKKIYFVKKNPDLPTSEDNWIKMTASEITEFTKTPEGKRRKKNFAQLDACDKDDSIYVFECGCETAKEVRAYKHRHDYLLKCERESGYLTVSYDLKTNSDDLCGDELIADEDCNVEEQVLATLEIEQLHQALQTLSDSERELINFLYFVPEPMTMTAYAERLGKPRTTVYHMLNEILSKLKSIMK